MTLTTFTDIQYILSQQEYIRWFGLGLISTIILSVLGTIIGLFLGIFIAFGKRIQYNKDLRFYQKLYRYPLKWIANIYSVVVRGTPMMVQAMIFQYFCLNIGINWNYILTGNEVFTGWLWGGLIVISLNTAAYMGEIIRSGLNGIGVDQTEGAKSLGMTPIKTLFLVELPQALKNSIPTIGNEWIVNIKDSSVLNVVGVAELFYRTKDIAGSTYKILACYLIVAAIYLVLTLCTTLILKLVSLKLDGKKFNVSFFHFKNKEVSNNA